jgi:predicted RNase H-like HicB family nuclease
MENKYTAVIKKDDGWWIGWVEEIPGVNCQEKTKEKLLETLRITLKEALEMNKTEALAVAESNYSEVVLEIWKGESLLIIWDPMVVSWLEREVDTHGGRIQNRIKGHQFQGIQK